MTTADAIRLAAAAAPETMHKVAAALRELEGSPYMTEVVQDFSKIASVFGERVKTAGIASDLKAMLPSAVAHATVGLGATVAGAGAVALASDLWSRAKKGLTKERNWKAIMAANPEIKAKFEHDPKKVRMAYDTLHRFAPDIAADPMAGGALLYNLAHSAEGSHMPHVRMALDAQNVKNQASVNWLWAGRAGPTQLGNLGQVYQGSRGGSDGSDKVRRGGEKG